MTEDREVYQMGGELPPERTDAHRVAAIDTVRVAMDKLGAPWGLVAVHVRAREPLLRRAGPRLPDLWGEGE